MTSKRTKISLLNNDSIGSSICVKGWVRTIRQSKNVSFISLNDGSTINSLQIVLDMKSFASSYLENISTGASLEITGKLVKSEGQNQIFELVATELLILGESDPDKYPIQPKKHSFEFLREVGHLRPRTNTFSAIFRIRHAVIFSIHKFFNERGFFNIHTPIITSSDAEGAGEMFKVTSLDLSKKNKNKIDFKDDFFSKPVNLTVSGQLNAELGALALSEVYTFGPTFRAENSNTSKHLAEFWMIEPEISFANLDDVIKLAIEMIKYIINYVLENYKSDLSFLNDRYVKEQLKLKKEARDEFNLFEKLNNIINQDFEIIEYTDAIEILKKSKPNKKGKFKFPVNDWGVDLQSEHEKYLVEKKFKKPVVIVNYPKEIKAFYMRMNDDNKTVAAMDILMPGIGEVIGGSQREERLDYLIKRMNDMNISKDELWWYLDTRKFGTVPHGGFGLGLERLVQFITGMNNIRDVIPFARTPKNIEF